MIFGGLFGAFSVIHGNVFTAFVNVIKQNIKFHGPLVLFMYVYCYSYIVRIHSRLQQLTFSYECGKPSVGQNMSRNSTCGRHAFWLNTISYTVHHV